MLQVCVVAANRKVWDAFPWIIRHSLSGKRHHTCHIGARSTSLCARPCLPAVFRSLSLPAPAPTADSGGRQVDTDARTAMCYGGGARPHDGARTSRRRSEDGAESAALTDAVIHGHTYRQRQRGGSGPVGGQMMLA